MPDKIQDNPVGDEFRNLADDGVRYRALTNVGPHLTGATFGAKDLGEGAQVQRLLDQAVIVRLSDEEARALAGETAAAEPGRTDPRFSVGKGPAAAGSALPAGEPPTNPDPAKVDEAHADPADPKASAAGAAEDKPGMFGARKAKP
jgi:hypothetical protein